MTTTTMIAAVAGACLSLVLALAAPTAMSHPELKAAYCPNNDTGIDIIICTVLIHDHHRLGTKYARLEAVLAGAVFS